MNIDDYTYYLDTLEIRGTAILDFGGILGFIPDIPAFTPAQRERLVHRADIHTGQPKRYQAAGTADLHHDVLEIMV